MDDSRLHSGHLEFPRRQQFRHARAALLESRGCLTLAGEQAHGMWGELREWLLFGHSGSAVPILDARYALLDQQQEGAYPLRVGLNAIGRYPNNDIVVAEKYVSRRHCVVLVHVRGSCELHDTASRNGTFVNGKRVGQAVLLSSGDRVQLASRLFLFVRVEDCRAEGPEVDGSITPPV